MKTENLTIVLDRVERLAKETRFPESSVTTLSDGCRGTKEANPPHPTLLKLKDCFNDAIGSHATDRTMDKSMWPSWWGYTKPDGTMDYIYWADIEDLLKDAGLL